MSEHGWRAGLVRRRGRGPRPSSPPAAAAPGVGRDAGIALAALDKLAALIALAALASGCASGRAVEAASVDHRQGPTVAERLVDAPIWVTQGCRAHWTDAGERRRVVCGVGSAPASRDRVRARETAVARARSEIARSLEVTIENLVRTADHAGGESELRTIVHQLSSASLRGCRVRSVWRSGTGEMHALVYLDVEGVKGSARTAPGLPPAVRQRIEERAADAFAELDARLETAEPSRGRETAAP